MANETSITGLDLAIQTAGGGAALGRLLGVSRYAVSAWRKSRVPAERVAAVSAATGIPAADLRPDLAATFTAQPSAAEVAA